MKKKIDIEKLVRWALCDEMPKGRPVSASPWDYITQFGQLGARIDVSRRVGDYDGFGFVPGAPHEDAERVVAAIRDLDATINGQLPDVENALGLFGELAPIAGEAARAVLSKVYSPRNIVLRCGLSGTRPAWEFEHPTPYRIKIEFRDAQGALRERPLVHGLDKAGDLVEMSPNRGRKAMREGAYSLDMRPRSPLRWGDPDLLAIGDARAEYLAWHVSLCHLVEVLSDLVEWQPTLPAARRLPWVTGQAPASRVLHPIDAPALADDAYLPIKPERPRSSAPQRRRRAPSGDIAKILAESGAWIGES